MIYPATKAGTGDPQRVHVAVSSAPRAERAEHVGGARVPAPPSPPRRGSCRRSDADGLNTDGLRTGLEPARGDLTRIDASNPSRFHDAGLPAGTMRSDAWQAARHFFLPYRNHAQGLHPLAAGRLRRCGSVLTLPPTEGERFCVPGRRCDQGPGSMAEGR